MTSETPHTGEGLALDFINTRPLVGGARRDFLADSAGLAAWLALVSLDGAGDGLSADDLAALHRLRDAGEACLEAAMEGAAMPEAALAEINGAAAAAPTIVAAAEAADGTLRKVARQLGRPGAALRARIAEALVDLLVDPALPRLRRCAADDCVVLFLPQSPRRIWCSAQRCGNRARVSRYYHRHKAE